MSTGLFKAAEQERESCTPPVGFNVCEYDPMGKNGDNLTVWKWFEDRLSAEAWADTQRAQGATMYVFGEETELDITETLDNYPHDDQHKKNYVATGAKVDSEPAMTNEEGWSGNVGAPRGYENHGKQDKIHDLPPHYTQETEHEYAKYVRYPHKDDILCEAFDGKIIDLSIPSFRPIPPSEDTQFTNTAINCKCYWLRIEQPQPITKEEPKARDEVTGKYKKEKDPHDPYKEIQQVTPHLVPSHSLANTLELETRTVIFANPLREKSMTWHKSRDLSHRQRVRAIPTYTQTANATLSQWTILRTKQNAWQCLPN